MSNRSKRIFGNPMSAATYKKAVQSKRKYIRRFGDDSKADYPAIIRKNEHIGELLGVYDVRLGEDAAKTGVPAETGEPFDEEKGIIVGNIRMGFGHYRISMAIASAANSMGYTPYWMDLNSYKHTTCTKVISAQNDLYSMGSRLSGKSRAFNKLVKCRQRDSGQLADGAAFCRREPAYGTDAFCVSGLPHFKRDAGR